MFCDHKFVGPPRCAKCGVHISELRAQMLEEQRMTSSKDPDQFTEEEIALSIYSASAEDAKHFKRGVVVVVISETGTVSSVGGDRNLSLHELVGILNAAGARLTK